MPNPYREIFTAPGTRRFALAGLVARMPLSMTGIGIITMLSQVHGSYWLAGAVAAAFSLTTAVLAPQISRLVDRYGQSRVLPIVTAVSVAAMATLLLCTQFQAPHWVLFLCAIGAGTMPSMPAMVRARWTELYRGTPQLHTAYSLESVLDEVCFIIGPPLSVGLSVAVFPEAGPLAAAILLAIGVAMFVAQKSTEPPVHGVSATGGQLVLRIGAMRVLVLVLLAMGVIVGTVDVVSVAFAEQQGEPVAASIVLSVYAAGSCLAGLFFGSLKLSIPLPRLFLIGAVATAVAVVPFSFAADIAMLSAMVFAAGLFFAPTMIVAMGLGEAVVPPSQLTEGLTWMITGLGIGVALGAALAGWAVDRYGIQGGFNIALVAAAVILAVALLGYRTLRRATSCSVTIDARACA